MNNFKKGGFKKSGGGFGARPKFSGGKKFGDNFGGGRPGSDGPVRRMELFSAVCSECKKQCQIPFRPTGDRPVYCHDCFVKQGHVPGRNSNGSDRPRSDRPVSAGLDFRGEARPRYDEKPQYQPPHLRVPSEDGIAGLKRQLIVLESKVNRILELVSKKMENPAPIAPVVEVAPKVAKARKKPKQ